MGRPTEEISSIEEVSYEAGVQILKVTPAVGRPRYEERRYPTMKNADGSVKDSNDDIHAKVNTMIEKQPGKPTAHYKYIAMFSTLRSVSDNREGLE